MFSLCYWFSTLTCSCTNSGIGAPLWKHHQLRDHRSWDSRVPAWRRLMTPACDIKHGYAVGCSTTTPKAWVQFSLEPGYFFCSHSARYRLRTPAADECATKSTTVLIKKSCLEICGILNMHDKWEFLVALYLVDFGSILDSIVDSRVLTIPTLYFSVLSPMSFSTIHATE